MHSRDVIERLRNPHPARQHGDIGNETDVAHELVALVPGISTENTELPLVRGETENGVERSALAGAVRPDQSEDAPLFDAQVDSFERDGGAKDFAETACFYAGHGLALLLSG